MKNQIGKRIGICIFWLLVWEVLARLVGQPLLLSGPVQTLVRWMELFSETAFWQNVWGSYAKIMGGCLLAVVAGTALAVLAKKCPPAGEAIEVPMRLCKTMPVASFVVLFLIWFRSAYLALAVVFVVVLPLVYFPVLEALQALQKDLQEMAEVFGLPFRNRLFYLDLPQMKEKLQTTLLLCVGMSLKSGVAAEVIGTPAKSIGQQLYFAKVSLDTAALFAWTGTILLLGSFTEMLVRLLFRYGKRLRPLPAAGACMEKGNCPSELVLSEIRKDFGNGPVLSGTYTFSKQEQTVLTWKSGSGKTTLLRVLSGLEQPDEGTASEKVRAVMLFQEDRLLEEESALVNVALITGDRALARQHLQEVLPGEDYERPVKTYSGGMKRRVALARAMAGNSPLVLLDEPMSGLDAQTGELVRKYIAAYGKGRIVVIASHER